MGLWVRCRVLPAVPNSNRGLIETLFPYSRPPALPTRGYETGHFLSSAESATNPRVPHPSRFLRRVGYHESRYRPSPIPPFAKSAKDPDFLLRGPSHGSVCGFKESRMRFVDPTKPYRKSRGMGHPPFVVLPTAPTPTAINRATCLFADIVRRLERSFALAIIEAPARRHRKMMTRLIIKYPNIATLDGEQSQ
jgi:hypothetical protein